MNKLQRALALFLLFITFFIQTTYAGDCLTGDIDENGSVNSDDLQLFLQQWLDPSGCTGTGCADFDGQNGVNFIDLAFLVNNWLETFDCVPPVPDPAAWTTAPHETWSDSISMTATTGYDGSVPVEYYFDETSGNPGGSDSGWQTSSTYTDAGLSPETQYTYTVQMRDSIGNIGGVSAPASATTRVEQKLFISEVMASNDSTLEDPQEPGEFPDWIEIYNASDQTISLSGMYLTDNNDIPTKFQIPSGVAINAGEYIVFFADDDPEQGSLHTNFKIKADGDDIYLFDTNGVTLIDSLDFDEQYTDMSFGRYPDNSNNLRYMGFPTPGSENNDGYLGQVEDTKFSVDRGFYSSPFQVRIATDTDNTIIRYTTDGKDPVEPNGLVYNDNSPIQITKTTVIRAAAYKAGWLPSNTDTQTYIFLSDVIAQPATSPDPNWPDPGSWYGQTIDYEMDPDVTTSPAYADQMEDALLAIPSICFTTDVKNLFDPTVGIYVNCGWYGYPGWERGEAWRRPVSVELINPDGTEGFQINAGLGMRGITSCGGGNPKHAFRLFFENRYGGGPLHYPLFGDEGASSFDRMDIRCEQNYSWNMDGNASHTAVREVFCRDLLKAMGEPTSLSRYYHLYLNGRYWGLYQTDERPESNYGATYFGGDNDDYDTVKPNRSWPRSMEVIDGNFAAYKRLWQACLDGFDTDQKYYQVQGLNTDGTPNPAYERLVDVNDLIDFMLSIFYTGDFDGPVSAWYGDQIPNNFFGLYNRVNPDGFKYFRHDGEHTMWETNRDRTGPFTAPTLMNFTEGCPVEPWPSQICIGFNPQTLHQYLTVHPEYVMHFADRVHKFFFNEGPMSVFGATDLFLSRAEQIDSAIIAESARWGDAKGTLRTKNDWLNAISWVLEIYMPVRTDIVLNQLRAKGWYPNVDAPEYKVNGVFQNGGYIQSTDSISIDHSEGTVYYTTDGSDPRVPASGGGGGTEITLISEDDSKKIFVPSSDIGTSWRGSSEPYDDSAWTHGTYISGKTGGVGYERSTSGLLYDDYISYDVDSEMYGNMASCYIRISFTVDAEDLAEFDTLTLKVRCDDGFVVFINGVEADNINKPEPFEWNSSCANRNDDTSFAELSINDHISDLHAGTNILAIHAMNQLTTSSDFLCSIELIAGIGSSTPGGVSPTAIEYTAPFTISSTKQIKARVKDGSEWSALCDAAFAVGPVADNLRITEIMYHPLDTNDPNDPNEEFIELKNIGAETINMNLVKFTKGIDFTFGDISLNHDEYIIVVKDIDAFESEYGTGKNIAGQYTGSLDNAGERIRLEDAIGNPILDFEYKDGWRNITDGNGYSLTINSESNSDLNSWGEEDSWSASTYLGGTPGYHDTGPKWGDVVINEILAHQDSSPGDWVELHNATGSAINITGWYLSDNEDDLTKYQIPSTVIPANGYVVLSEDGHFGSYFALSENGETVCLTGKMDANSHLTGYRQKEEFGASENGVSFGRHPKSTGTFNFVPMSTKTYAAANAYPKVGPVIITEIMYRPEKFWGDWKAEYIELYNTTGSAVHLYDVNSGWKFTDGIQYTFPPSVSIPAHSYMLLVRNLVAFNTQYPSVPPGVQKLQWTSGKLDNDGEKIELSMPGDLDENNERQFIRIDRVVYSNGSHPEDFNGVSDPWPRWADGGGYSLTKINYALYGNDPNAWAAYVPSPGQAGISPSSPNKAVNPFPSNGATGQPKSLTLSWSNGGGAMSYDVYFGTDPTPDSSEYKLETTITSYTPDALLYNTTYYWRIDAKTYAGTTTGDVWSFTTSTTVWTQLTSDTFESGNFGNYTDGGFNCSLYHGTDYSHGGNYAVDIQAAGDPGATFYHTNGIDVDGPGYTQIKVDFWYIVYDLEPDEKFYVEYYDGSVWRIVATFIAGVDFQADASPSSFYNPTVYIDESSYTFPTNAKIRFRCAANAVDDDVYIDDIIVSASQ